MGCVSSTPKVKESKSPARKVSADAGNSVSQRRPATGSSSGAQAANVSTAPPAPVAAAPVPSSEAPPKEQPSLGKVPSGKLKPSGQAPVQQEEASEKKKERTTTDVVPRPVPKSLEGEHIAAGWPSWLASVAGEAIKGWVPRRADSFEKLDKVSCLARLEPTYARWEGSDKLSSGSSFPAVSRRKHLYEASGLSSSRRHSIGPALLFVQLEQLLASLGLKTAVRACQDGSRCTPEFFPMCA